VKIRHPPSLLWLILLGFLLVALPLLIALGSGVMYVNRLANQSQQALLQVLQATQTSRTLVEQITAMERNARQFVVLGDESLFHVYAETHRNFHRTWERLVALPIGEVQRRKLQALALQERTVFETLRENPYNSEPSQRSVADFNLLSELAQSILAENSRLVDREVEVLQAMAGNARRTLILQATALIPVAVLLTAIFTFMIARPIRQMGTAIRRLGDGDLSTRISVSGPQDLESLGGRLEWLRERLLELQEAKSRFLGHVSHELKTPLSSIREGAALLVDEVAGPLTPEQREVAEILRQNSIHLQELIEDLLTFNIVQAGTNGLNSQPVALDRVIERVCRDQALAIQAKGLTVRRELANITVLGEEGKLAAIVDNLLSNAVKYSPRGGVITLSLRCEDAVAVLDISDMGPGIHPDDKPRLFDAFYQGRTPHHSHVKGTGLGLSIVREHVIAHAGNVEVVEEEEGPPGAHFRVRLPTYKDPAHAYELGEAGE
jgi:two-component system, NtrC family, sensor histidine kinase GlrK